MSQSDRYEACWVPGLDSDFDADEVLEIALDWLASVPVSGTRIIAMSAKSMKDNRPLLTEASQSFAFVSPRSRASRGTKPRAVLAVWPDGKTLELAQQLALDGALCVIGGTLYDVTPWIVRSGALNLVDPEEAPKELTAMLPEVSKALDHTLFFGGNNRFGGGAEKQNAIRTLRSIIEGGHRPSPGDIENYALASGETNYKGARRLREYYEGLLAGKSFRDYSGRVI